MSARGYAMRRDEDDVLRRVYDVGGVACFRSTWSVPCSGCNEYSDGVLVAGPFGCRECGFSGRRRFSELMPFDLDTRAAWLAGGAQ